MFSAIREPFNCLSHLCGAIAAFFGSIVLIIVGWTGTARIISLVVYGLSLVGLFSTSAIYHMVQVEPRFLQTLRNLIIRPFIYLSRERTHQSVLMSLAVFFVGGC